MDFIAIDFETANHYRTSACSIGIAMVKNNQVMDSKHFFIKPEPFYFDPFNVMIHGITEDDVIDAPTFVELWPTLETLIDKQIIVAHNASFDISVMRRTLEQYNLPNPNISILCTYRIIQAAFPDLPSYRLNDLCEKFNIELEHHQAESDAIACANILCNLMNENSLNDLVDLETTYSISAGFLDNDSCYKPCQIKREKKKSAASYKKVSDYSQIEVEYIDDDFIDKGFTFTGTLLSMSRNKALELVAKAGGIPCMSVTKQTNYLVLGIQDFKKLRGNIESKKTLKAKELREKGQDIKIISEAEFIDMIDDELYRICFIG